MEFFKEYRPKTSTDTIAMSMTFLAIPFAFLHGVLYVTPTLYPSEEDVLVRSFHYIAISYCLVTVLTDLLLTMVTDTSCQRVTLSSISQPGWSYCSYCQQYVPPRTHHCLTCQKCFLRRDHHCYFVGRCVGYQNHKYFMLFVFHCFVTCLYSLILSIKLVLYLNGGVSFSIIVASILPVMAWTMLITTVNPIVLIATSTSLLFMVMCGAMLILHVSHLYKGQTFWEAQNGVPQPRGWLRNARDVLGSNWWIIWLCPLIPSPLPADGLHYPPKEAVKPPPPTQIQTTSKNGTKRKRI